MKYGEVVQDLAARGHNWKFYDAAVTTSCIPMDQYPLGVVDAFSTANRKKAHSHSTPSQSRTRDDSIPKGYCFKFSKGVKCFGCAFKHLCYRCDGSHQPKLCNFRSKSKASNNDSQPAQSQLNRAPPAKA